MSTGCPILATPLQLIVRPNSTCEDVVRLSSTSSRSFGDNVTFSCEAGCELVYQDNITQCRSDGTWTRTFPFCKERPIPNNTTEGLSRQDVIIIASTVGGVAAIVFLIILILLLCQRFCRRDPDPDERKKIINQHGQNSFLSRDYIYDNNFDALEFRDRSAPGPTRSRSFNDRRGLIEGPHSASGFDNAYFQRTASLDYNRMRQHDNRYASSMPKEEPPIEYETTTLPAGTRLPTYHVPRPRLGGRFEPLWHGSVHHI